MEPLGCPRGSLLLTLEDIPMGTFAVIAFIFILMALGIWVYYTFTDSGRKLDVVTDLKEANLQSDLVDSIEKTREVQAELHERVVKLRK